MKSKKLTPLQTKIFGWLFVLTGLPFILISFDLISIDTSTVHAPLWVLGLCGFIFSLAGFVVILGEKSPINNLLGGILVLSFGLVGGWVALFGGSGQFSGGLPF